MHCRYAEAYLGPCQIFMTERFCENSNDFVNFINDGF